MDDGNIFELFDELQTYILMIFCDMCFTISTINLVTKRKPSLKECYFY